MCMNIGVCGCVCVHDYGGMWVCECGVCMVMEVYK